MGAAQTSLTERLEALLSESVESARRRESAAFDELAAPFENRLVLFGAGQFGRRTLAGLQKLGIEPLAFADNNPAIWGRVVDGIPVLSPSDAARQFGASAAFLITIWNGNLPDRTSDRIRRIRELGCRKALPVGYLFWKYPQTFLPFYPLDLPHKVLNEADEVLAAFQLWNDDLSRREYVAQVGFRLLLDLDSMTLPDTTAHYFPQDVYHLRQDEVLIDCGAFDGDTVRSFVRRLEDRFARIVAYEPDGLNYQKLHQTIEALPEPIRRRIQCLPHALGAVRGSLKFDFTGTELSKAGEGQSLVLVVTLDESLKDEKPTIIKFDIEGAELDALAGTHRTIHRHLPVLAISAYHRQSDLWKIPMSVSALSDDYRFSLRPHGFEGWDLVCYAVPAGRVTATEEA